MCHRLRRRQPSTTANHPPRSAQLGCAALLQKASTLDSDARRMFGPRAALRMWLPSLAPKSVSIALPSPTKHTVAPVFSACILAEHTLHFCGVASTNPSFAPVLASHSCKTYGCYTLKRSDHCRSCSNMRVCTSGLRKLLQCAGLSRRILENYFRRMFCRQYRTPHHDHTASPAPIRATTPPDFRPRLPIDSASTVRCPPRRSNCTVR